MCVRACAWACDHICRKLATSGFMLAIWCKVTTMSTSASCGRGVFVGHAHSVLAQVTDTRTAQQTHTHTACVRLPHLLPARGRLCVAVAHVVHKYRAVVGGGGQQLLVPCQAQARDGAVVALGLRELACVCVCLCVRACGCVYVCVCVSVRWSWAH